MKDDFSKPFCDLIIKQHKYFIGIYNLDMLLNQIYVAQLSLIWLNNGFKIYYYNEQNFFK